ncbi:MAG: nucleotidyltransferase domain-containing protein [Actinomycetota bacterium]
MSGMALSNAERRALQEVLQDIPKEATVVLLVGSWARGASDDWSDIDILVVGSGHVPRARGRVQVLQASRDQLVERLEQGDDFVSWVIRFAKPIRGRSHWQQLKAWLSTRDRWPNAELKRQKAAVHLKRAQSLAAMGDEDAAEEEARLSLSHLARAVLLERGVFPLSRPELSGQLEDLSEQEFARALAWPDGSTSELLHLLETKLSPGIDHASNTS